MRERTETNGIPSVVLDAISQPVIMVSAENYIAYANLDAEQFFRSAARFWHSSIRFAPVRCR